MQSHPTLALHGLVLFPGMLRPMVISEPDALLALAEAIDKDLPLACFAQVDEQLAEVGCLGKVLRSVTLGDGSLRILVQGHSRVVRTEEKQEGPRGMWCQVMDLADSPGDPVQIGVSEAYLRQVLEELLGSDLRRPTEMGAAPPTDEGPQRLADYAAGMLQLPVPMQQVLLEEVDLLSRLEVLALEGTKALDLVNLSNDIQQQARMNMDRRQRNAFLKEQITVLQAELGQPSGKSDLDRLAMRLQSANMPAEVLEEAERELGRLRMLHTDAAEYGVTRTWLDTLADLPWDRSTVDDNDMGHARAILNGDHHGLEEPKQRLLEYLAVRQLNPNARGAILCLIGPPGVGKTSLAATTAQALGREFQKVSLGGVRDEAEIRGHRRTYIGALPGRIMQAVRRAGTRNPVLVLDEMDKLSGERGDPAAALLEVLDVSQNHRFEDHYLGVPFDLSQVLFIATANVEHSIPTALLDRLELIRLPGYIEEEKTQIARQHLLPRVRERVGLSESQLRISPKAMTALVRSYTREPGVRELERQLERIFRRMALRFVEGRKRALLVREKHLSELLGPPPYRQTLTEGALRPGVALGLAWTPAGGEVLHIEAAGFDDGNGNLQLTGSLGDVMKESVQAAMSLLRSRSRQLSIASGRFKSEDFHVHCPSAGIPKDGPSAGVAMLAALSSLMLNRSLPKGLAMSGELTLRGQILPVGGVKAKVLAARRAGMSAVLLPEANRVDLAGLDPALLGDLSLHYACDVEQIFDLLFPSLTLGIQQI